jgi:hypothetical protein
MPFYIFKFDYPWATTWHVIEANDKAQARKKAISRSHIPESKVIFWKKKGSLPKVLAGRTKLPPGWRVDWK